jgi:tRNA nucleotidyltransferase (CCA-adding enzyme)
MSVLFSDPPRPYEVRYLMSTPVQTISPNEILDDVHLLFQETNISGAPVITSGKIVGIISKRDIQAAVTDGRSHLPVSSCMVHEVETIDPNRSITRTFEKMADANVGRLPVIEDGKLVGIITRNDILKLIYKDRSK